MWHQWMEFIIRFEYSNGGTLYTDGDTSKQEHGLDRKSCSSLIYFTNIVSMRMFQCISIEP